MSTVIADRRVHPGTIALRALRGAPQTVVAIPAGLAIVADRGLQEIVLAVAALALVSLVFQWLEWSRFRYGVGASELVIESGILNRNRRSIPFDRIQDVDIERALLARLFGLAKVRIETGAGGKDEGVLDSVTTEEAARLRATVRAWREGAGSVDRSEAQAVPAPAVRPLFAMPVQRVLLYGLFNFSLVYLGGLFAALQAFDRPLARWFGFDIYDPARWTGLVDDAAEQMLSAAAILIVLILAVLIGILLSVLRILARDFDFLLVAEGDRFRRERGLLTRSEAVIAKRRVQLAYVETGPIRRMFGWFWLSFQTLGAASDGSGHQVAAPFARHKELLPVLAETPWLRLPAEERLAMVSQRHIVRALLRNLVAPTVAILVAAIWEPRALVLLAMLPLLGAMAALERRFHRYGLEDDLLFVRRGIWRQQLFVVPVTSNQAISLTQGWLQRRLGLATVAIDTAGAPATRAPRIVDLQLDAARSLVAEIAARASAARLSP